MDHPTGTFGSLDILINITDLIDPITCIAENDYDAWCQVLIVNVKHVYHDLR